MKALLFLGELLLMSASGALGALFFKKAAVRAVSPLALLRLPALYAGGFFYLLGAGMSVLLLRTHPYTVVYPLTSLTYVWTLAFSARFLGEKIGKEKLAGVGCILAGALLLLV